VQAEGIKLPVDVFSPVNVGLDEYTPFDEPGSAGLTAVVILLQKLVVE
jgi:hypothetical protein